VALWVMQVSLALTGCYGLFGRRVRAQSFVEERWRRSGNGAWMSPRPSADLGRATVKMTMIVASCLRNFEFPSSGTMALWSRIAPSSHHPCPVPAVAPSQEAEAPPNANDPTNKPRPTKKHPRLRHLTSAAFSSNADLLLLIGRKCYIAPTSHPQTGNGQGNKDRSCLGPPTLQLFLSASATQWLQPRPKSQTPTTPPSQGYSATSQRLSPATPWPPNPSPCASSPAANPSVPSPKKHASTSKEAPQTSTPG